MSHTPPEIWKNINEPRTVKYDVYGFAILLWELLAEEQPFKQGILHCCDCLDEKCNCENL